MDCEFRFKTEGSSMIFKRKQLFYPRIMPHVAIKEPYEPQVLPVALATQGQQEVEF